MTVEVWRPIPQWEMYEVSDLGRVRRVKSGRVLRQYRHKAGGYMWVYLWDHDRTLRRRAHQIVLLAFVGPRPVGHEVRHLDGNPENNRLENLRYGTPSENAADKLRHGTNLNAAKTRCDSGHPFDGANTYIRPNGNRACRACRQEARRRYEMAARRKSQELPA